MSQCDVPQVPLLPYDDALRQLVSHVSALDKISSKPLMQALGEVLAESQQATISVPPADNSAMDGYALNMNDIKQPVIAVSQRIAAGESGVNLEPGTAARIFTGAPIPEGADTVVMQEQVTVEGDSIRLQTQPVKGQNIRPMGNDIKTGDIILTRGMRLRGQDIGLAASVGLENLAVFDKVRVGMFFTGDELVEPGTPLAAGKIYDSNRYTLYGLLKSLGCDIVDLGVVGDTLDATRQAMLEASSKADLVVTCGGVSVGEEDYVRIAIEQLGDLYLWRLKIKPGKPLAFGKINNTAFVGLPGNPVSVFATFCLFVCPLIKTLQGRTWQKPLGVPVRAGFDWSKPDSRREFLRARLEPGDDGNPLAMIYPNQDSGVLTSTVWAKGFVEIGEDQTLSKGDFVNYLAFSEFLE
ncbi:MAG: molybdopterin molybdotransferase MoeA [Gammaproteobacteria bacterium]|nr:molybdopterin molybdotransferase MoeA [Gammaproteobacteria bacterium]